MERAVRSKRKECTIREGWRDYRVGDPVLIGCHLRNWAIMATVTEVQHVRLFDLTSDELAADGFDSVDEAVQCLSQWYKNIEALSKVTFIAWEIKDE